MGWDDPLAASMCRLGSFGDDFSFSIETLATVGYGEVYQRRRMVVLSRRARLFVGWLSRQS
jgi:hypothetical protein